MFAVGDIVKVVRIKWPEMYPSDKPWLGQVGVVVGMSDPGGCDIEPLSSKPGLVLKRKFMVFDELTHVGALEAEVIKARQASRRKGSKTNENNDKAAD